MGRRTGQEPGPEHTMIERLCHSTDLTLRELAKSSGIPLKTLEMVNDPRMFMLEWQKDDTWWLIKDHIDRQLGMLMAFNADLNRQLQRDRTRQATRIAKARSRQKRSSPRS